MEPVFCKVSAPGKLMLLGEHAVLHGNHALVCAINHRVNITCYLREDRNINIFSALGNDTCTWDNLAIRRPFTFCYAVLDRYRNCFPWGMDIHIESEFSATVGFGSSAAITASMMAIVYCLMGKRLVLEQLLDDCLDVVKSVQGKASGADLAASIYGGVLSYCNGRVKEHFSPSLPLTVVYSGRKTPTVDVINMVERQRQRFPEIFSLLYEGINTCTLEALEVIKKGNWKELGEIFTFHQGLLDAIGVNDPVLSSIVFALRKETEIFGAKISGSGLGDCIVGVGKVTSEKFSYPIQPVSITTEGLLVDCK